MLKTIGYMVAGVSVVCLVANAWGTVKDKPVLAAFLSVGMATSILGMFCRWTSYLRAKHADGQTLISK